MLNDLCVGELYVVGTMHWRNHVEEPCVGATVC